jgi:hypothetical protein
MSSIIKPRISGLAGASQGFTFSLGLGFFIFGFYCEMWGDFTPYDHNEIIESLVYAIFQTAGLFTIMVADVDANAYLRRRPKRVVVLSIMLLGYTAVHACSTPQPISEVFWIQAIPLVYLLVRWDSVIKMKEGFPRFTEFFVAFLLLDIAASAIFHLIALPDRIAAAGPKHSWEPKLQIWYKFFCILCNMAAYYLARWRGESLTLSMNAMLAVYNFLEGMSYLLNASIVDTYLYKKHVAIAIWLVGPIHIIPGILLIVCRPSMHGKLGQWWLQRRIQFKGAVFDLKETKRGNLPEVEAAITSGDDLNAFVWDTAVACDDFTLLMYASANNFVPAVEKLLSEDAVAVNFASRSRGWSALHLACQCGNVEVTERLVDHHADVNQRDYFDGFSPLYMAALYGNTGCVRLLMSNGAILNSEILLIASAMGHSKVVSVLMAHGADQNRKRSWMGVAPADAAQKLRQSSVLQVLRAYESEFVGNILPDRGVVCVVSWPGIYSKLWDHLVSRAKASEISAAVVFLPERTENYGKHSSDKCYCDELYGEVGVAQHSVYIYSPKYMCTIGPYI